MTSLGTSSADVVNAGACRRLLDAEGWTNDITLLRKALEATDRKLHQMRLSSRLPGEISFPILLVKVNHVSHGTPLLYQLTML